MSKRWYPVIDYEKCIGCGQCIKNVRKMFIKWRRMKSLW